MPIAKKQFGFTLIETIIVISIFAIIGSLSVVIIGRSLDSYAALDRREKLQASTRLVLERISRELRNALPYSLCVHDGVTCSTTAQNKFYFIPIKSSGRYQDIGGRYTIGGTNQQRKRRLRVTGDGDGWRLDVISTNQANRLDAIGNIDTPPPNNTGDWVVVFNTNNNDVYQGINNVRHQIYSITPRDIQNDGDPTNDIDYILFSPDNSFQVTFANHSIAKRLNIIAHDKVTLFYKDGRNLYRDTTTFTDPDVASGNQRLLMENVETCTFTYIEASSQKPAVLRIDLTIEDQGEKIQIIHEALIYNAP